MIRVSAYTAHEDTFVLDRLPPSQDWPVMRFDLAGQRYPERLNCSAELLDRTAARNGDRVCLISDRHGRWTYQRLLACVNRVANVLVDEFNVVPGNRVLLRGGNSPMLVACLLAVIKAGGIAALASPMLRTRELSELLDKARPQLALCAEDVSGELIEAAESRRVRVVAFGSEETEELDVRAAAASPGFESVATAATDPCLIAFTSGTTGVPRATVHSHRDVVAVSDSVPAALDATADDVFAGNSSIAFTYGLGALVLFPMTLGAASLLHERPSPESLFHSISEHDATVCFSVPTAYRVWLDLVSGGDLASLRICVSSGEALPASLGRAFHERTGLRLVNVFGMTEMLHAFIAAPSDAPPGSLGKPIPGYEVCVLDDQGEPLARGEVGQLAVRGPTGCLYLADEDAQRERVVGGWNVTGDAAIIDTHGFVWHRGRTDEVIISAGYSISPVEVEDALLAHTDVAECGVVGSPDPERGAVVKAVVVLKPGRDPNQETARALQAFVKGLIAPYKYPRQISFARSLPRTATGKIRRSELLEI